MTTNVIEVKGLTKKYKKMTAVDNISFQLQPNVIYGLIGKNGAGKTTLLSMLTSQLLPSSGAISIFGKSPYENLQVQNGICFIKESQKYPEHFLISDVLDLCAHFYVNWDAQYARKLVTGFKLSLKNKMGKLSRGQRSAVGIIIGLASRAPITILDEPYVGLDVANRGYFYSQLIEDYANFPRTFILSTHLIDEVSDLLEHILVIDGGKLILQEEVEKLQQSGFYVSGAVKQVKQFIQQYNCTTLHSETLGDTMTAIISGALTKEMSTEGNLTALNFAPVPLQKLIVYTTRANQGKKGVKLYE